MKYKNRFTYLKYDFEHLLKFRPKFSVILSLAIIIFYSQLSFAQDTSYAIQATKFKNVTWYGIAQVNFKQGKMQDALSIVKKYFIPASKAAGNPGPVMALENFTGQWDMTIIWRLKDGPSDLEWKVSPEGSAFRKQLVKLLGSKEKANKLWQKYDSYIVNSTYNIAMQEDALAGNKK